jgi:hypothetical protein
MDIRKQIKLAWVEGFPWVVLILLIVALGCLCVWAYGQEHW